MTTDRVHLARAHIFARVVSAVTPFVLLAALVVNLMVLFQQDTVQFDFGSFLQSGRAVNAGLDPYPPVDLPNLNAPVWLPLFQLLALLQPMIAFRLWQGLTAVFLAIGVIFLRRRVPVPWFLALAPLWATLLQGQVYGFLFVCLVIAWQALRSDRQLLAGAAIGVLVASKPNFAIWPLLLLFSGRQPVALLAAAVAASISLLPPLMYGPGIYLNWLQITALASPKIVPSVTNGSLAAVGAWIRLPQLELLLGAALVLLTSALAALRRLDDDRLDTAALCLTLLLSPVAWVGYALILIPGLLSTSLPSAIRRSSAAALILPFPLMVQWGASTPLGRATVGWIVGWISLASLISLLWHAFRSPPRGSQPDVLPGFGDHVRT